MYYLDMFTSIAQLKEFCRRHLVVLILVALAAVEALSISFIISAKPDIFSSNQPAEERVAPEPILKISEIQGPQIDDEAAMTILAPVCSTLPAGLWVFLLIAYAALLIFNFSYTFEQAIRPQWFFELTLALLVLIAWYVWDECRTNIWFPFAIVKFGLIIFALYAYLLEKKPLEKKEQPEKTESLF